MQGLFIEETTPGYSYDIVWRQGESESVMDALDILSKYPSPNRLELWSKQWATSPNGFAPIAFREKDSNKVFLSNTLNMLINMSVRELGEQTA